MLAKVLITMTGMGLVLLGLALLVLPGPGWLTIAGGLAVLRREYGWAGRLLDGGKALVLRALKRPGISAGSVP